MAKKAAKKELTYDEVKARIAELKEEKKPITSGIKSLRLKHKVKKGTKPSDKAAAKEWDKLHKEEAAIKEELAALDEMRKELKPAGSRATKYEYPQVKDEESGKMRDMDSNEKKKYRAQQRAAAKKAESGDDKPAKKSSKKEKTSSKKEKASSKKDKAAKKGGKKSKKKVD